MNKNFLKKMVENGVKFSKKNAPEILAGVAIVLLVKTAVDAYKAGPKASKIIAETKESLNAIDVSESEEGYKIDDKKAKREVIKKSIKKLVPVMAPVVVDVALGTGIIIASNRLSNKKLAMLSAAYTISENSLKDLNNKMVEIVGDKKARDIKDAIVKDKVKERDKNLKDDKNIIITGDGDVLCMDLYSEQKFRSNAQKIGLVINRLSGRCADEMYVTLNDLYSELNIHEKPFGNNLGWNVEDMIHHQLPIYISAQLTDEQVPVLCLDYDVKLIKRKYYGDFM